MASKGLRDAARVVRHSRCVGQRYAGHQKRPGTPHDALPLIASSRTAFVFAAAASAPLLQRPRAFENATHEVLRGAELQDPAQIPCSQSQIPSTRVGLRLPACYRKDSDNLASAALALGFRDSPRSLIHVLHQRFA